MMNNVPIITIDGPSSSGKGTISRLLAEKLNWHFLDSGAVYRVLAYIATQKNIQPNDTLLLVNEINKLDIKFNILTKQSQQIIVAQKDVTLAIRREECGTMASKIAANSEIRRALTPYLQGFCRSPGLVADGRDMGTVVFPAAQFKIFLTASAEERARRRLLQLQDQGINATLAAVLQDLRERDERDQNRVVAPLKPDSAAMIVDTTKLSINEVLQLLMAHVNACLPRY